jgi:hypothetical protein
MGRAIRAQRDRARLLRAVRGEQAGGVASPA